MTTHQINFERLMKLRLAVARFGEMDAAGWWNTRGQLGPLGKAALRRGFPRTHAFARARSVFAVAAHRCTEVFDPPGCVTLWRLPEELEEEFEARWERWLDSTQYWADFFNRIENPPAASLLEFMQSLDLLTARDAAGFLKLRRSAAGRTVQLPGMFTGTDEDIALLAVAFGRGERGELAVPYARRED